MKSFNIFDRILEQQRMKHIYKHISPGCIMLDFGCGDDYNLISSLSDKIDIGVGIDKKIKEEGKVYNNIFLYKYTSTIKDSCVDLFVSLAVLEHLPYSPTSILKEWYRVIKKGGKIVITTPSPMAKPVLEFLAYKLKIINKEEIDDHKYYYNKSELKSLFEEAGFVNVKVKSFQFGFNTIVIAGKEGKK